MDKKPHRLNLDGLFRQNIVLMSGLVTAPVIVCATTAERAALLSLSFLMISFSTIIICRFIPRKIAYTIRILIYAAIAAVMFIPTAAAMRALFPETAQSAMIYIEILVVNSLILAKTESRFYLQPFGIMAADVLIYIAGYAMAAFVVGIIREFLAFGTFFGFHICNAPLPAAKSAFFGFILLGFFAAACRAVAHRKSHARKEGSRR